MFKQFFQKRRQEKVLKEMQTPEFQDKLFITNMQTLELALNFVGKARFKGYVPTISQRIVYKYVEDRTKGQAFLKDAILYVIGEQHGNSFYKNFDEFMHHHFKGEGLDSDVKNRLQLLANCIYGHERGALYMYKLMYDDEAYKLMCEMQKMCQERLQK